MTIRFTGVATGVRNEATAATATHISTGRADTPSSDAADRAMGMTMIAVAVLLISWPKATVSSATPRSSR
jgi:hypothetical protein